MFCTEHGNLWFICKIPFKMLKIFQTSAPVLHVQNIFLEVNAVDHIHMGKTQYRWAQRLCGHSRPYAPKDREFSVYSNLGWRWNAELHTIWPQLGSSLQRTVCGAVEEADGSVWADR